MRYALLALLLTVASAVLAAPQTTFSDSFASYAAGSDGAPTWESDSFGWEVRDGRLFAECPGRSFAVCTLAARGRTQVIEATLTLRAAPAKDWKTAGVVLYDDNRNYWHLAFVESPDDAGKKHYIELQESYDGSWLATGAPATRLTGLPGQSFEWEYNHPYRLRLEITQDTIVGTFSELDGTLRGKLGYKLDNPKAVVEGTAALDCGGFQAEFADFKVTVTTPLPPKPVVKPTFPPFTAPGYSAIKGKATGFFHPEQIGGRWWLITPKGDAFYAVGTDHANYNAHWCEKLGYAPYHRNCVAKYNDDEAAWGKSTGDRLKAWNFNALGCGYSKTMRDQSLPRCEFITFGAEFSSTDDIAPKEYWTGFPNVFSPRWEAFCQKKARRFCTPLRDDPWIIGYFLDNELEWFGKNHKPWGLFDECSKKPAGHSAKEAQITFLKARYPSIEAFNAAWKTKFASWDALRAGTDVIETSSEQATTDRLAFVALIADRYFKVTAAAVKAADPNHCNLGCRFAGYAPPGLLEAAGKYCDIVTVNYYGHVDLDRGITTDMPKVFAEDFQRCQRPMMITEWSFPAYDSGLPCEHGAGQRVATQAEKARCYEIYQTALMAMPFMVGSNYFMWVDEPALGISSTFPEDSNYGLVDVNDNPWVELTQTATRVNARVYEIHAGKTPEMALALSADGMKLTVRNAGATATTCDVDLWVDGQKHTLKPRVAGKGSATLETGLKPTPGGHVVAAFADPRGKLAETDRSDNAATVVAYRPGLAWKGAGQGAKTRVPVVVSNATAQAVTGRLFAQPLRQIVGSAKAASSGLTVVDATTGAAVLSQVDGADDPELCFAVGDVGPYSAKTFLVCLGAATAQEAGAKPALDAQLSENAFVVNTGALTLKHDAAKGELLSEVLTGKLPLGAFRALLHQQLAQDLWVGADKTVAVHANNGPLRFVADVTVACTQGGATITAAEKDGAYAARQTSPQRYEACYRIAVYPGQAWFTSRLLWVRNTDTASWRLASYYHYAVSAIGGTAVDDTPAKKLASSEVAWENPKLGAYYGFLRGGADDFKASYWRDAVPNGSEHPDVWRDVDVTLAPGQRYADPQPAAAFFGLQGTPEQVTSLVEQARALTGATWKAFEVEKR